MGRARASRPDHLEAELASASVPARLLPDADGQLVAELAKQSPSGDPFSLLDGSCYALVPSKALRDGCQTIELAGSSRGPDLP